MSLNSKRKGSALEYEVVEMIKDSGLDDQVRRSIMSGAVFEPGDIKTKLAYSIECKSYQKMAIYKLWEQAVRYSTASKTPALAIKANNKPILAVISFDHFLELIAWAQKGGLTV